MNKKHRKILIETAKVVVAIVLLAWVLSKTSWNDYVTTTDGKTYSLREAPPAEPKCFKVSEGFALWKKPAELDVSQVDPLKDTKGQVAKDAAGRPVYVRQGFESSIRDIDPWLLAAAMVVFLASMIVVATRWWFLLRLQEIHIRWWEAIRLTFLGNFFNNLMPSTVGGDLVKAYYVSKHKPGTAGAVLVSIFVDRVLGLTELALLAAVMILLVLGLGLEQFEKIKFSAIMVAVVIALVIFALTFLLSAKFRRVFRLDKLYQRLPIAHHIAAAGNAAELYRKRMPALLKAIGITVGAQVLGILSVALIGMSLHIHVETWVYFVYIPLIWILAAIPISLGGVGWTEKLYVDFFSAAGAGASAALAMALLARMVQMFWALPGVIVAVTGPRMPKSDEMAAELKAEESAEQQQQQ